MFGRHQDQRRKIDEAAQVADAHLQRARQYAAETNRLADDLDDTKNRNHLVDGLLVTLSGDGLLDSIRKKVQSWARS